MSYDINLGNVDTGSEVAHKLDGEAASVMVMLHKGRFEYYEYLWASMR